MTQKILLVDIDGTISLVGDRRACLDRKPMSSEDWDEFYNRCGEDQPNTRVIELLDVLSWTDAYSIVLCSGRRESCRDITEQWLRFHGVPQHDGMLLRADGDHRHDVIVKPEMVATAGIRLENIALVLEDRASMVAKWRELGLVCLQVAEGAF